MNNKIISLILMFLSVSAFAQSKSSALKPNYKIEKVSVVTMATGFFPFYDLEFESKIGNCQIVRKDYDGAIVYSGYQRFVLQIQGPNKTVGIVIEKPGTIFYSKDRKHIDLKATSFYRKSGRMAVKELKVVIKNKNNRVAVSELSITTKYVNKDGSMQVVKDRSITCLNK